MDSDAESDATVSEDEVKKEKAKSKAKPKPKANVSPVGLSLCCQTSCAATHHWIDTGYQKDCQKEDNRRFRGGSRR